MFDPKQFDDMAKKIAEKLPEQLKTLKADAENNIKMILAQGFSKLDLVTREEFDIQTKVLARTREKVEQLEDQVAALYDKLGLKDDNEISDEN